LYIGWIVKRQNKETPDYQLDLTPFISLLSVCICFLLLTVTWFQVGALSVKQVQGGETSSLEKKEPVRLWVFMKDQKDIEISVKRGNKNLSRKLIKQISSEDRSDWDFAGFQESIHQIKTSYKGLDEVFILPTADILYENIVKIMDKLRQENLASIGLTPL